MMITLNGIFIMTGIRFPKTDWLYSFISFHVLIPPPTLLTYSFNFWSYFGYKRNRKDSFGYIFYAILRNNVQAFHWIKQLQFQFCEHNMYLVLSKVWTMEQLYFYLIIIKFVLPFFLLLDKDIILYPSEDISELMIV